MMSRNVSVEVDSNTRVKVCTVTGCMRDRTPVSYCVTKHRKSGGRNTTRERSKGTRESWTSS